MSSQDENVQPIDLLVPKIENNESIIDNCNMEEELKYDNNLEQLDNIKIEIIEQINDSDQICNVGHIKEEDTGERSGSPSTGNVISKSSSSNENNLKCESSSHLTTHPDKKVYVCGQCSTKFSRPIQYVMHIQTHTGHKPYVCDQCTERFAHYTDLVTHTRIHSLKEPYICDQCNERFTYGANLVKHIKLHTGNEPFVCNICDKKFVVSSHLKQHMKIHSASKTVPADSAVKDKINSAS